MSDIQVIEGDCLKALATFAAGVFDAVVTDPPAGISFMGRDWDHDKGGRDQWISWMHEVASECLRVIKPGGHALVWALPRTSHWTATAWENAGWEVRDRVSHLFGSGFPKSLNVSKAIDRQFGAVREVIGTTKGKGGENLNILSRAGGNDAPEANGCGAYGQGARQITIDIPLTAPATPEAQQWDGWGTALKPACEDWWLLRAPLSEKTVASNVLRHGTGALNIAASRVPVKPNDRVETWEPEQSLCGLCASRVERNEKPETHKNTVYTIHETMSLQSDVSRQNKAEHDANSIPLMSSENVLAASQKTAAQEPNSRYPSNVILDGSPEVLDAFAAFGDKSSARASGNPNEPKRGANHTATSYGQGDDTPTHDFRDTGTAVRFYYSAKADALDRANSSHPTVKPVDLIRYLVKLITPPGGRVLDPFAGSGTTGKACQLLDFDCTLIEKEPEYVADIRNRFKRFKTNHQSRFFKEPPPCGS